MEKIDRATLKACTTWANPFLPGEEAEGDTKTEEAPGVWRRKPSRAANRHPERVPYIPRRASEELTPAEREARHWDQKDAEVGRRARRTRGRVQKASRRRNRGL